MSQDPGKRARREKAFREAEAISLLSEMEPTGPIYEAAKARVIAGEIDADEAVAMIMASASRTS